MCHPKQNFYVIFFLRSHLFTRSSFFVFILWSFFLLELAIKFEPRTLATINAQHVAKMWKNPKQMNANPSWSVIEKKNERMAFSSEYIEFMSLLLSVCFVVCEIVIKRKIDEILKWRESTAYSSARTQPSQQQTDLFIQRIHAIKVLEIYSVVLFLVYPNSLCRSLALACFVFSDDRRFWWDENGLCEWCDRKTINRQKCISFFLVNKRPLNRIYGPTIIASLFRWLFVSID